MNIGAEEKAKFLLLLCCNIQQETRELGYVYIANEF